MPKKLKNRALMPKEMRVFFDRKVSGWYGKGVSLKKLSINQHGHFEFKSALSYNLDLITSVGPKKITLRGNVPSVDTIDAFANGMRLHEKIYQSGFAKGHFLVPRPLGFYKNYRLGLYENFPGTTLLKAITKRRLPQAAVRDAARWLTKLHQSDIPTRVVRSFSDYRKEAGYFLSDFQTSFPQAYAPAQAMLKPLLLQLATLLKNRKKHFTVTHGDYHPANVILHPDGQTGVIDLGSCVAFDPLSDVANFLAQVDRLSWDHIISFRRARTIKDAFIKSYALSTKQGVRAITPAINYYYIWWVLQILAYSVVIRSLGARQRLVYHGIRQARKVMEEMGHHVLPIDLDMTRSHSKLRRQLVDSNIMLDFFNHHLATIVPQADHIISLDASHPKALATTSYLTRYHLKIMDKDNVQQEVIIRGNYVPKETYILLDRLAKAKRLNIMVPAHYIKSLGYLFYREVPGIRFRELSLETPQYDHYVGAIARTTARLHHQPALRTHIWRKKDEAAFLRSRLSIISKHDLASAPRVRHLVNTLLGHYKEARTRERSNLHGDLQASNIIVQPGPRAVLIDFTMAIQERPAHDVANFLTHLSVMLTKKTTPARRQRHRRAFLRHYYNEIGPQRARRVRQHLTYYEVRAIIDIIAITVTNLPTNDADRQRYTKELLAQAEKYTAQL